MWIRLVLAAIVFWIAAGFTNPMDGQQLVISGDSGWINPELGAYVEDIVPGDKREYKVLVTNPEVGTDGEDGSAFLSSCVGGRGSGRSGSVRSTSHASAAG